MIRLLVSTLNGSMQRNADLTRDQNPYDIELPNLSFLK